MPRRIITSRFWPRPGATPPIAAAKASLRPSGKEAAMMTRQTMLSLIVLLFGSVMIATAIAGAVDVAPINAMDRTAFVQKFGGIFENSPWVAEKAWEKRPFASLDDVHAAMVTVAKH